MKKPDANQTLLFSAAVVGLGNIGQGLDYDETHQSAVLTHAKAFTVHSGFKLMAGVDPDPLLRKKFEAKYQVPAFESVAAMNAQCTLDVIALAVPSDRHLTTLKEILVKKPKAILCEKPLATSLTESEQIVKMCKANSCMLALNYVRRFEPGVQKAKELITKGELGEVYKGTVWYSKGILNNGSHFVDLLHYFFGKVSEITVLNAGRKMPTGDWEPDVLISFGKVEIYFLAAKEENFSMKEITLIGDKGVLQYSHGGREISLHRPENDSLFTGYKHISTKAEKILSNMDRYQYHVAEALHKNLSQGIQLNSDGESGLETSRTVEEIILQCESEKKA